MKSTHRRLRGSGIAVLAAVAAVLGVVYLIGRSPRYPCEDDSDQYLHIYADRMHDYLIPAFGDSEGRQIPFRDMKTFLKAVLFPERELTQPPYGCSYIVNVSLSGASIDDIIPSTVIAAVESRPEPNGTRGYAYVSGTVKRVAESRWRAIYYKQLCEKHPIVIPGWR